MKVLAGLTVALAAAVTQAGDVVVATCILPLLVALTACHVERDAGRIAEAIVAAAVVLLPKREQQEWRDVWTDHIRSAGEHGVLPLYRALSIFMVGAPALAVGLRIGRAKQCTY